MRGGDISNEVPRRFIVSLEYVASKNVKVDKILGVIPRSSQELSWDLRTLSFLWYESNKLGVNLELAIFDDEFSQDEIESWLDIYGTNPFNYVRCYDGTEELVRELPYRNDVLGVICPTNQVGTFGSWAVTL